MKPPAKTETADIVAFGAHPDDIEFGCGAVVARETQAGRRVHFVICSEGESATNGTPAERVRESRRAAGLLGASVEFCDMGGDAHFEVTNARTIEIARILRRWSPSQVLAPSTVPNQHPDHAKLGEMVRDAARLARFGGVKELRDIAPQAIRQLFFYAVTPAAEPVDGTRVLIDVSGSKVMKAWKAAMEAHATQARTRNYSEIQLTRSRLHGLLAGVEHAIPLWANDPLVFESLETLSGARRF